MLPITGDVGVVLELRMHQSPDMGQNVSIESGELEKVLPITGDVGVVSMESGELESEFAPICSSLYNCSLWTEGSILQKILTGRSFKFGCIIWVPIDSVRQNLGGSPKIKTQPKESADEFINTLRS